jgi:predicted nuclease of predicted toxin-antitoxin system
LKFKLDENLGNQVANFLRRANHDVATVPEENLCSSSDLQLLKICEVEGRCLVTLDLDFGNPLNFPPKKYAGIAVLRLPEKPTPEDLLDAVGTMIAGLAGKNIERQLWVIQRGRIRVYQPEDEDI